MSFVNRAIQIAITLAPGASTTGQADKFSDGSDTITLEGFRTSVTVSSQGSPSGSSCQATIYGVPLKIINQLATLGLRSTLIPRNSILVKAGDVGGQMSTIFGGAIMAAYADFNNVPEPPLHLECKSGFVEAVTPTPATSVKGPVDVATVLHGLANLANWGFENSGINVKLPTTYSSGSILDQVKKICVDANINFFLQDGTILAIWPKNGSRNVVVPTIQPQPNGTMIGYPSYTAEGITIRDIYNPNVAFGGQVIVKGSSLTRINGTWNVGRVDQILEANLPGGRWETIVYAYDPKFLLPASLPVN